MDIKLVQFSLVVVANDHNPTLLNPDFLDRQGIVMSEWGWSIAGDSITTPPFARVSYNSGVAITVETNKFQVADQVSTTPSDSKIEEIAKNYVKVLPHIPYSSVGVNFQVAAKFQSPEKYVKDHFLKDGNWDTAEHPIQTVGMKLVYPCDGGRLVMNLDHARLKGSEEEEVVLVAANFHRECSQGMPVNEQVLRFLEGSLNDWDYFNTILADVLSEANS